MALFSCAQRTSAGLFLSRLLVFAFSLCVALWPVVAEEGYEVLVKRTEEIRGLKFKTPIVFERLNEASLDAFLETELSRQYTPQEWQSLRDSLAMLGAFSRDVDLQGLFRDLLNEQAGGLYDPHTGKMYVIGSLSLKTGLAGMILAHELTHALTDQHFHLLELPIEDSSNDDKAQAALSVVEGDATIAMILYGKDLGIGGLLATGLAGLLVDQDTFASSPALIQSSLMLPYLAGENFLREIMRTGRIENGSLVPRQAPGPLTDRPDWEVVNYLYKNPPLSTEQVLHPEKYLGQRDDPVEVKIDSKKFLEAFGPDWELARENTLGEGMIQALLIDPLSPLEARDIAAGWDGDRYALFRSREGASALCWRTVWDTGEDAAQFRKAMEDLSRKKVFNGVPVLLPGEKSAHNEVGLWIVSDSRLIELVSRGTE